MIVNPRCYKCKNLDPKKKSPGKVSGNLYQCKKLKSFVQADTFVCDKFEKAKRSDEEMDKIREDAKNYYNDRTSVTTLVVIVIILIVLGLILGVFKM